MSDDRISGILKKLEAHYEVAATALNHNSAFELLVATILSAQCTDKQVNKVTEKLFLKHGNPYDFARMEQEELEKYVKSCGFYRMKSRNIIETSRILVEKHEGKVPAELEELVRLPGVGRKTANVVLSNAFGVDAIAVDTHVFRVSRRLGLAHSDNEYGVEKELMEAIPENLWSKAHHWLIRHGRELCSSRKPKCGQCFLNDLCDFAYKTNTGDGGER